MRDEREDLAPSGQSEETGDDTARFEEFVRTVAEPVRRYLARRTDPETADDVLADALLACWRRFEDVPTGADALPWTYAVARRCLANAERGSRRQRRVAGKVAAIDPPAEAGGEEGWTGDEALYDALDRLRPAQAEVLRLWAWEQLTPAEIGVVLEVSPNAASSRLSRARSALRDALAPPGDAAVPESTPERSGPEERHESGDAGHEDAEGRQP